MKLRIKDIDEAYVPLSTALSTIETTLKNHIQNKMGFKGNVYVLQTNIPQVRELHLDDGIQHHVYRFGNFNTQTNISTRPTEISFKRISALGTFNFYQYKNRGFLILVNSPLSHPVNEILNDYIKNKNNGTISSQYTIYEISRLYDGNIRNTNDNTYSDQVVDTEFLNDLNKCMRKISKDYVIPFISL